MRSFYLALLLVFLPLLVTPAQTSEAPEQLLARAVELHQTGELESAIRAYQTYLAQRPAHSEARSNLGAALAKLGRYQEAIEQYQQALTSIGNMNCLILNHDATERYTQKMSRRLIIIAGNIGHESTLARFSQNLLHDVIMRLVPIPATPQCPAINNIADQIQILRFGATQELRQFFSLTSRCAQMQV